MRLDVSQVETALGAITLASTTKGLAGLAFDNRVDGMWRFLEARFGNPSSSHAFGTAEREGVAEARARVEAMIARLKAMEIGT